MISDKFHVIGVMSGTSLDGIDICEIIFSLDVTWNFNIVHAETIPYTSIWKNKLKHVIELKKHELEILDNDYTQYLGEQINGFISRRHIDKVDAICSHGHTVFHQPDKGITYQIGNLPELANVVGYPVVCDFRLQDVALGGQGAPLVPIGDALLFSQYIYCLNLGGFANISYDNQGIRIAYDICPVNIVLNKYVERIGLDYDDGGKIAQSGLVNQDVLNQLNKLEYYGTKPPKSLGLEWVKSNIFPLLDSFNLGLPDLLRTFVEHIAIQIAKQITNNNSKFLITGGGAYNRFLISRIMELTTTEVVIPSDDLINFKEALIFGLLGVLKLKGDVNCLSSVTGAKNDHCSGHIFVP